MSCHPFTTYINKKSYEKTYNQMYLVSRGIKSWWLDTNCLSPLSCFLIHYTFVEFLKKPHKSFVKNFKNEKFYIIVSIHQFVITLLSFQLNILHRSIFSILTSLHARDPYFLLCSLPYSIFLNLLSMSFRLHLYTLVSQAHNLCTCWKRLRRDSFRNLKI